MAKSPPKPSPIRVPSNPRGGYFTENIQSLADFSWFLHNHPSGDPSPSTADVQMTKQIIDVARPLGIAVHDHLIIGKAGHASMKALRLI